MIRVDSVFADNFTMSHDVIENVRHRNDSYMVFERLLYKCKQTFDELIFFCRLYGKNNKKQEYVWENWLYLVCEMQLSIFWQCLFYTALFTSLYSMWEEWKNWIIRLEKISSFKNFIAKFFSNVNVHCDCKFFFVSLFQLSVLSAYWKKIGNFSFLQTQFFSNVA